MNRSVIIVGAGAVICPLETVRSFPAVIAADGGYSHIRGIMKPMAIIGDFDSLSLKTAPKNIPTIRFPKEKDETDIELALKYAIESSFDSVYLTGVAGERHDHFFAALSLLEKYHETEIHILTGAEDIFLMREGMEYTFEDMKGSSVSFFSVTGKCTGIHSSGFEYEYKDSSLKRKNPIGISNSITDKKAKIKFEKGKVLCFLRIF